MFRKILILLGTLGVTAAHADPADRSVITIRHMEATPDEVIQAFVDSDDLTAWWQVTRSLVEPEKGGVWSIAWDDWGEEKTHHSWSGVISDIGPGLPEDQLEAVFEPFRRHETSRSRDTGGTGLGLAIARTVIRAHGGEVTLRNRQNRGLMAIVELPL